MLSGNPNLDRVLPFVSGEDNWSLTPGGFAKLRGENYDVALSTNTLRHHPDLLLAAALGIPDRVAFGGRGFSALITHPVAFDHPQPYPAYFRSMVASLACTAADWALTPGVYPSGGDHARAQEAWDALGIVAGQMVLACTVSTRQAAGAWPIDYFEEALRASVAATGARLILCGSSGDMATLERLAAVTGATILRRELPILAFAAFLSRCDALFAMDSGPRHIANAVATPVVFMRNLTFSSVEAGAYCDNEVDAAPPVERLSGSELTSAMREWPPAMAAERIIAVLRSIPL